MIFSAGEKKDRMQKETDLTKGKISGHFIRMSLPASIGFIFNTLYNITDTYFGGQISTEALAGLSLSFPAFFIILAVGSGIGTASVALISNAIGSGNSSKSTTYFIQALLFSSFTAFLLLLSGEKLVYFMLRLMNASGDVLKHSLSYMNVIIAGTPFFLINNVLNSFLNAKGNTYSYRNVLIAGFFINIVLDPVFLYGWGPFPGMGIAGIALSTVLIQAGASVYLFMMTAQLDGYKGCSAQCFIPKKHILSEIISQSVPSSVNMMSVAAGMFVINFFLNRYGGGKAVAAYGIGLRIEQIALLPTIGINTALLAITGQNAGACKFDRVRKAFRTALFFGFVVMVVMLSIILPPARFLVSFFTEDAVVSGTAVFYLKIVLITYYCYILLFCSGSMLQGLKKPAFILWAALYRQIAAPFFVFWVLCDRFGTGAVGVFWGIAIVNWSAAFFIYFYSRRVLKRVECQKLEK